MLDLPAYGLRNGLVQHQDGRGAVYAMLYARGGVMTNRRALAAAAQPVAPTETAASAELSKIAQQVATLRLCWSDPWAFYERRSDLAAALRRASRRVALLERLNAD